MQTTKTKPEFLEKTLFFVSGFFLSILIVAIGLKFSANIWGVIMGSIMAFALALYTHKYQQEPTRKILAKGMFSALITFLAGGLIFWLILLIAFQGIMN